MATAIIDNRSNDDRSPDKVEVPINTQSVTGELSGELPGVEFRNTMPVVEPPYTSYGEDGYNGP